MIDILRSTPETKDTKVIVMTALSQEEDRERGKSLGADHYIVKSQVTLDDVVKVVQEMLGGLPQTSPTASDDNSGKPADDPALAQLDEEVQQFVANSPLMNGAAPRATTQQADLPQNQTPPVQAA